jgi:hypothetical protein
LFAVFGFVFGGIGLAVLIFLWSGGDEFGAPPLFFRIFGSFIAIAFVAFGGTMVFSFLKPKSMLPITNAFVSTDPSTAPPPVVPPTPVAGYTCPHCGATLGADAEVSPLGDVKCTFCGRWFNLHKSV